ncbi:MAG: alpha/beta fold hydrolase [Promethearchaeota archaeon]
MPKIKVNGINLYYEVRGEGFPIVMIMGLTANIDWWDERLIKVLSENWKVILFDNRGTGRSDNDRDFTLKDMADDTIALMDALDIKKAHVYGYSMGGMIAQELVLAYPDRIKKLILSSTSCGGAKYVPPSQEVLKILMQDNRGKTPYEVVKNFIKILFTKEFYTKNPKIIEDFIKKVLIAQISYREFNRQMKAILAFKTYRRLKTITTPTLVMHGKKDILSPFQNGVNISKLIPGAQLELFENCAHQIFEEEFEKVIKPLIAFLK